MKNIKPLNSQIQGEEYAINESLNYHLKHQIGLLDSVFRIGSDSWLDCVNEARSLWEEGFIELEEDDLFLISTDAGKKEIFEGKEIELDKQLILQQLIDIGKNYETNKKPNKKT